VQQGKIRKRSSMQVGKLFNNKNLTQHNMQVNHTIVRNVFHVTLAVVVPPPLTLKCDAQSLSKLVAGFDWCVAYCE
jgi:hypothetical protein